MISCLFRQGMLTELQVVFITLNWLLWACGRLWNGSYVKVLATKTQVLALVPNGNRREQTPRCVLLTSTCTLWLPHVHAVIKYFWGYWERRGATAKAPYSYCFYPWLRKPHIFDRITEMENLTKTEPISISLNAASRPNFSSLEIWKHL